MKKILVCDDDQSILDLVKATLEAANYSVVSAENGKQCLDMIIQENPDLLLLDVMMPELDGVEVVKRLKSDKNYPEIPIIMLTSQSNKTVRLWFEGADIQGYVTKPFETENLLKKIGEVLK